MKTLIYSARDFEIPYLEKENKKKHELVFIRESLSSETAVKAIGYKAISIFSIDDASYMVLEKLKDFGVKYITLRSTGYDNVNLNIASMLNFRVANVPSYSPHAIAEHSIGLLLALNRKLIESNLRIKRYNFEIDNLIGFDLNKKKIGIIGTGKIGSVMSKIMHGFGCELLGYDVEENEELIRLYNMNYLSLIDLCKASDIILIHTSLNKDTHHLINKKLIDQMKPGVIIINTARGAIINTKDVIYGLKNGIIKGLGIDVYENEKKLFFKDHSSETPTDQLFIKLNTMPNVLITGHHAFLTEEALSNIAETTISNLNCWSKNLETENELTNIVEAL